MAEYQDALVWKSQVLALIGKEAETVGRIQGGYAEYAMRGLSELVKKLPPAHGAVQVASCQSCGFREECTRQLTMVRRNYLMETNEYRHPVLLFCSYGKEGTADA